MDLDHLYQHGFMKKLFLFLLLAGSASAQFVLPNATPMPYPRQQFYNSAGKPLAGAYLCTFAAGTSTPQMTYTSASAGTPNSNPIVLDGNGSAIIFAGPNLYKIIVYVGGNGACPGTGVSQFTVDNFGDSTAYFVNFVKTAGSCTIISYTPTVTGGIMRTCASKLGDFTTIQDLGTAGSTCTGSDDTTAFQAIAALSNITVIIPGKPSSTAFCKLGSASVTIPASVGLVIQEGGGINVSSTFTLTIQGSMQAGLYQIFSGAGTIAMGGSPTAPKTSSPTTVYPQWWNAKGDKATDDSAAFASAVAVLAAGNGGILSVPCGQYEIATGFSILLPTISMIGGGSGCTVFYSSDASFMIQHRMNPFTITEAGTLSGFTIDGTSAGAGAGILTGDTVGSITKDVKILNFTSGIGLNIVNDLMSHGGANSGAGWFERNTIDVQVQNDAIGVAFKVLGGTDSFGYNKWDRLEVNTVTGQTGLVSQAGTASVFLYNNFFGKVTYNGVGGQFAELDDASNWDYNYGSFQGECSTSPATTGFNIESGARFLFYGYKNFVNCTDIDSNTPAADNAATYRFYSTNIFSTMDGGVYPTWFGVTASQANMYPLWMQNDANGGEIGIAVGGDINSPWVSMLDAATNTGSGYGIGNCFCIFKDAPGDTVNQKTLLDWFDEGGRLFVTDSINPAAPSAGKNGQPGTYVANNKIEGSIIVSTGQTFGATSFQQTSGNSNYASGETCVATPYALLGTVNQTLTVTGGGGGTVVVASPITWAMTAGPATSGTPNRFTITITTSAALPATTTFGYICVGHPN